MYISIYIYVTIRMYTGLLYMRSIDMLSVASGQETVETTGRLDLKFPMVQRGLQISYMYDSKRT